MKEIKSQEFIFLVDKEFISEYISIPSFSVDKGLANNYVGKVSLATKRGTITGEMNYSPVNINLNKVEWKITGQINNLPLNITINHEISSINGQLNENYIFLRLD